MSEDDPREPKGKERMRRRAPFTRVGMRSSLSVKGGFTDNQLKEIGAIILEWNELEEWSGILFAACLDLDKQIWTQVFKAINGLDARVSIINSVIKNVRGMPNDVSRRCNSTLSKFTEYKKIRDSLGHCRMWNEQAGIAHYQDPKGKWWEILVTDEALNIFFRRIDALKWELVDMTGIFGALSHRIEITSFASGRLEGAKKEEWRRSTLEQHAAQLADHQKATESIPALPLFPDAHHRRPRPLEQRG
jgi:hypothetical protein